MKSMLVYLCNEVRTPDMIRKAAEAVDDYARKMRAKPEVVVLVSKNRSIALEKSFEFSNRLMVPYEAVIVHSTEESLPDEYDVELMCAVNVKGNHSEEDTYGILGYMFGCMTNVGTKYQNLEIE